MLRLRSRRKAIAVRRKLSLEALMQRALLAGITSEVIDGIATILGTAANDQIVIAPMVQREEVHLFVDGECLDAWPQSALGGIDVQSAAGDDLIRVGNSLAVPVKVTGGSGLDTVLIDNPQAHRHGWLLDVEQMLAEGEFRALVSAGHDAHAGHGTSAGPATVTLFPFPSDHLHVESLPSPPNVETPSLEPSTPTSATSALPDHGPTVETSVIDTTNIPGVSVEHSEHDSHGSSTVACSCHSSEDTTHLEEGASTAVEDHPSHEGHVFPTAVIDHSSHMTPSLGTASTDHASHGGYSAGMAVANHSSHTGHDSGTTGTDHSSHARHGMGTAVPEHSSHVGHGQRATPTDHSSHGGGTSDMEGTCHSSHTGHGGVTTATDDAPHAGHSQRATSADHSSHGGHRSDTAHIEHSSHAGHDHHGAGFDSLTQGEAGPDTCHGTAGNGETRAVAPEQNTAVLGGAPLVEPVAAGVAQPQNRLSSKLSRYARFVALAGTGTLLYIYGLRRRRSETQPQYGNYLASRLSLEWLDRRGAPSS